MNTLKMNNQTESAATLYCLHQTPPYILHQVHGTTYRVMLNGQTLLDCGNGLYIPLPGCPCPEKLAVATMLYFAWSNRRWLPVAVGLAALLVLTNVALMATEGGEIAAAYIRATSYWMNTGLLALAALSVIAYALSSFKRGLTVKFGADEPLLLPSGEISIAPDFAVFSTDEMESQDEYQARVNEATKALLPGQWLLVMPFRSSFAVIRKTSNTDEEVSGISMLRSRPVMQFGVEQIDVDSAAAANSTYTRETWAQYIEYCKQFANDFKVWAPVEKLNSPNYNPIETVIRGIAVAIATLIFCSPAYAQKSKQVREYLGDIRFEQSVPDKGADVSFVFEKSVLSRTGNGQASFAKLLPSSGYYTEQQDQGKLIAVTVDGKVIAPVSPSEQKRVERKEASSEALPIQADVEGSPWYERLPDSNALETMKTTHLREKRMEWRRVGPVVAYYEWRFWGIMGFLLVLSVLFWIIAKVSATDSVKSLYGYAFIGNAITGVHVFTKTFLFIVLCVPTVFILVSDAIRVYYLDEFSLFLLIKYVIIAAVWYIVFEKILPDSPQIGRGMPVSNYPNQQRLNG